MTSDRMILRDATRRLSERQSECLRLMARGHTSKEIASNLQLSVETVHAHLKAARRTLAVGSSRQAARMLADAEGADVESVGTHEFGIAHGPDDGLAGVQRRGDVPATTMEDESALGDSWAATLPHPVERQTSTRSLEGRLDDLTPLHRSLLMVLALTAAVIVIAGLAAIATSLQSMLWSIYHGR